MAEAAPAPHIHKYFARLQAFSDEIQALVKAAGTDNVAPEFLEKLKAKKDALRAECEVFLRASFALHNPSGSGALTAEEATAFFEHLVHEEGDFIKAVSASALVSLPMADTEWHEMFAKFGIKDEAVIAGAKAQQEETLHGYFDIVKEKLEKATADYEANRAEMNTAAFKVIAGDGSETIQLSEFLAAMDVFSEKGKEFQKALGFDLDTASLTGRGLCSVGNV